MSDELNEVRGLGARTVAEIGERLAAVARERDLLRELIREAIGFWAGDEPYEPSSVTPWLKRARAALPEEDE